MNKCKLLNLAWISGCRELHWATLRYWLLSLQSCQRLPKFGGRQGWKQTWAFLRSFFSVDYKTEAEFLHYEQVCLRISFVVTMNFRYSSRQTEFSKSHLQPGKHPCPRPTMDGIWHHYQGWASVTAEAISQLCRETANDYGGHRYHGS